MTEQVLPVPWIDVLQFDLCGMDVDSEIYTLVDEVLDICFVVKCDATNECLFTNFFNIPSVETSSSL
jgi:hypothetical protein